MLTAGAANPGRADKQLVRRDLARAFEPRNGKIAFVGLRRLSVVSPSGGRPRTISRCAAPPSHGYGCIIAEPAWSPDGTRIAYVRGHYGGLEGKSDMFLYVASADGRGARRLASCGSCGVRLFGGGNLIRHLSWSPDSERIAFSRNAAATTPPAVGSLGDDSLWVVAAAGGRPHRITNCDASCHDDTQPAWSPGGHLLAFERYSTASTPGIYTVRQNGMGLTRIASGANPEWSPDGRRIAFDSGAGIEVAGADGSQVRLLFAQVRDFGPGGLPSWSPDGRKLVFLNYPDGPGGSNDVWVMNSDGSAPQPIFEPGTSFNGVWTPPIWSPDGRMIALSAASGNGGTFVIDANGTHLRKLSSTTAAGLSWQPRPPR
jgi:TolB protein